MGQLDGKVAFVTGAARGQGRSHAIRLAQEGADIIAIDICNQIASVGYPLPGPDDLRETVNEVEALDRRIVAHEADVRDAAAVKAALDDGIAQLGRLDIVCANAGIVTYATADEMSDETWDDMIDINLTGVFKSVRAAIPHLKANENGGAIVITSSTAGIKGMANIAHYASAKHGVVGLMKSLRDRVGAVQDSGQHRAPDYGEHRHGPQRADLRAVPAGHPGRPDLPARQAAEAFGDDRTLLEIPWVESVDISNAILWLVSDAARYVTGCSCPWTRVR